MYRDRARIWYNALINLEYTLPNDNKLNGGIFFFRRKDAVAYLNTLEYSDLYEVVGCGVDQLKSKSA